MDKSPQNKSEVLRYLGYQGQDIDEMTDHIIEESMEEIRGLIEERFVYQFFNIDRKADYLLLKNTELRLRGNSIRKHLADSKDCILMAATLGSEVDRRIKYYEKVSMTKALVLDACATVAIEEICNKICSDLEHRVAVEENTLTLRFSPGYGDLPLDLQKSFLGVLGAEGSIGLNASSHYILTPRKSVTAIIGIVPKSKGKAQKDHLCESCNQYATCLLKKGEKKCGNSK